MLRRDMDVRLENQTVKWDNYYHEEKTFYNQTIDVDPDDQTLGKWGDRDVVYDENGCWYEDFT
jgi:hypothetical protein